MSGDIETESSLENIMKFDLITLGDHLPDPRSGRYNETQAERHQMWIDMAVKAEELGFAGVMFGEHHCSDYIISAPQMLLAAVAARTKKIRLGTAVSLLPNNDPVRLAEDFATLDLISNGRAEIGFGSGLTLHTFNLYGQDIANGPEMSAENLELLEKLWNENDISWEGRHRAPIHDTALEPRTFSGRSIPISRATASSLATAEHAGKSGHKLMLLTIAGNPANFRPLADAYRAAYRAAGHDPAGMSVAMSAYCYLQDDAAHAKNYWRPYIANYRAFAKALTDAKGLSKGVRDAYAQAGASNREGDVERWADFVGDPALVIDKIQKSCEMLGGADRLLCYFDAGGLSHADSLSAMRIFAEKVIPACEYL
jgi:alkanesulfonate monooxygenase SsuD/methylene tetrahydromethanopterin reductase-like flavin-dependent oxidoreductase (luciferase family)